MIAAPSRCVRHRLDRRGSATRLAGQCLLAAAALGWIMLRANTSGAMLLVPLSAHARAILPGLALDGHAALLGRGVVPGSLLVRRDTATPHGLLGRGILAVPAPARWCGAGSLHA